MRTCPGWWHPGAICSWSPMTLNTGSAASPAPRMPGCSPGDDILTALHLPSGFEVLVAAVQPREDKGEVTALDSVVLVHWPA